MALPKAVAFVDGLNLYHALDELQRPHLKWLDVAAICRRFAPAAQWDLARIYYFTALYPQSGAHARHQTYIAALEAIGLHVIYGRFGYASNPCRKCKSYARQEKETDVNIAIRLLSGAISDEYDRAMIVSADSDQCPAVKEIQRLRPDKSFLSILPPGRRCYEMAGLIGHRRCRYIERKHVEAALLPAQLTDPKTGVRVDRPPEYLPPP